MKQLGSPADPRAAPCALAHPEETGPSVGTDEEFGMNKGYYEKMGWWKFPGDLLGK